MLHISLTKEEKEIIKKLAQQKGMSMSSFLKHCAMNFMEKEQTKEAENRLPEVLDRFISLLDALHFRLDQLEKKIELAGEEAAVGKGLMLIRLMNCTSLSDEQYRKFREQWPVAEERLKKEFEEKLQKEV